MKLACALSILCAVSVAEAQRPDSLTKYLATHPWDSAKSGPLIVVDPDHTLARGKGSTLQAFDRKLVKIGGLSAIVPTEMVLIDDSLKDPPNFYDGLPMDAKVLYLLSTMTAEQVQAATSDGVGMRDLQGEQVAVFKSILPAKLSWATHIVGANGYPEKKVEEGSVPSDQMDQVRLKIQSGLSFKIGFQNEPRAWSGMSSLQWYGRQGDRVTTRTEGDKEDSRHSFGLDPRKTVPNVAKQSNLNYRDARFDASTNVPETTSIKELLAAAGSKAGVEIIPDLRVGRLSVRTYGPSVRTGDLLKAVALCVTGAYRKVGDAYVLTSDVVGMGARKLKFAAWAENLDKELQRRESAWRLKVHQSGNLGRLSFDKKDALAPDERAKTSLSKVDDMLENDLVPASELTSTMRDFVSQFAKNYSSQAFRTDQVGLHSQVQFAFVLPGGQPLHPESQTLGDHVIFALYSSPRTDPEIKVDAYSFDPKNRHPLVVRAESPSAAKAAIDEAAHHGFTEVWLETHDAASLSAALNKGLKVSFVARPWAIAKAERSRNSDLNVLGQTGTQLSAQRAIEQDWKDYQRTSDLAGNGPPPVSDLASPLTPDLTRRFSDLMKLAHTPGLAGVVLLDTQPFGYEPVDGGSTYGGYPNWLSVLNEFGYSDALRLAFLRNYGVDPIDIASTHLRVGVDIEQPFFRDDALRPMNSDSGKANPAISRAEGEWTRFRADLNTKAINQLADALADISVPISFQARRSATHMPPNEGLGVVSWIPGQALPQYSAVKRQQLSGWAKLYTFNEESSLVALRDLGWFLKYPNLTIAVDASTVPTERLKPLLDRWFPRTDRQ